MLKVTAKEMDCSIKEIAEMSTLHFGWTAETCGHCKSTVNATIGAGWVCPCGEYNIMSWNNYQIPHANPVYGPSLKKIRDGYMLRKLTCV